LSPTIEQSSTPAPSPTTYTIDDFADDYGLNNVDDIRKEYQRSGRIYLSSLGLVSPDDLGLYRFAFKDNLDDDLYNLAFDDKGWFIDTNSYPIGKEDIREEIWRWVEGRSGEVVITDGNIVIYRIAGITFFVPTPTPGSSSGGSEDSCPADRQKDDGGCCPLGYEWNGLTCFKEGPD
jgi:hypothetical protein